MAKHPKDIVAVLKQRPIVRLQLLKLLLPILLLGTAWNSRAQTAQEIANKELRAFFSTVTNPTLNVKFLYDMSAHMVDSSFFGTQVYDTSNLTNWYNIYHEMYYAAYDTTLFLKDNQVFQQALPYTSSGEIPIGIIDWDYNLLKPAALTTGNFFTFDTVNNIIYDIPGRPSSPYTIQNVFAAAPLRDEFDFGNPLFRIDPAFIFKDASKIFSIERFRLRIDFGDNTGWHNFTGNTVEHYQPNYTTVGNKLIKVAIYSGSTLLKYSHSTFKVTSADIPTTPTTVVDYPGMTVSYYEPTCTVNTEKKYVVYLEGIDILNNRHASTIYRDMIQRPEMTQLKNFGYTFVVVDYKDTYLPLATNAMNVVKLLDDLKCSQGRDNIPPPFVVIGESMSGLIARYALCYMESKPYLSDASRCQRQYMHNTRLLIEIDAPNQGANVPLADQYLYKYLSNLAIPFAASTLGAFNQYLNLLNGSAGEMLIYHVSTDVNPAAPVSNSTFGASSARINFLSALNSLGNYPRYCKKVALSNGSAHGINQRRFYDGAARVPNDQILDLDAEIYLRILGIRILGSHHTLDMRTLPNGNGRLFHAQAGVSHWKIKLKWFGVKLVWWTDYLINIDKGAIGVQPFDVTAGSYTFDNINLTTNTDFNFLSLIGFTANGTSNQLTGSGNIGIPWFCNLNLNFTARTDGTSFNFIPTQSSMDYTSAPLNYDILGDPVGTTMSKTPFDVIYTNNRYSNRHHLTELSPQLGICSTCLSGNPNFYPVTSYLLNREIGDDSLWLENTVAGIAFRNIEAEQVLMVNHRNIYYNYPSSNSALPAYNFGGSPLYTILSKENPYKITSAMPNSFRSNIPPLRINPAQPLAGPYTYALGSMTICCIDYRNARRAKPGTALSIPEKASMLSAFPNPVAGSNMVTIKYQFAENAAVSLELYDITGRKVMSWMPNFEDNTQECYFPVTLNLQSGTYLLRASNGQQVQTVRLVVSH
jgi:hypothetical protein